MKLQDGPTCQRVHQERGHQQGGQKGDICAPIRKPRAIPVRHIVIAMVMPGVDRLHFRTPARVPARVGMATSPSRYSGRVVGALPGDAVC